MQFKRKNSKVVPWHQKTLKNGHKRIIKNQQGSAAVEFAMIIPLVIIIVFSALEAGVLYFRTAMVEISTPDVTRDIYTGFSLRHGQTRSDMVDAFCGRVGVLMPCSSRNVTIEVRRITVGVGVVEEARCTNSGPGVGGSNLPVFDTPVSGDLLFIRFCIVSDLIIPGLGGLTFQGINAGLSLPEIPGGGYAIATGSVFRLEPF